MSYRKFAILKDLPIDRKRLRSQTNYLKVATPARPFRARTLGYKNTNTMIVVQARVQRGGIAPSIPTRGRHPSNLGRVRSRSLPLSRILGQRVARRFLSHDILCYYPLAKDGQYWYYQYILHRKNLCKKPQSWIFR